jgi:hypothetical protein
MPSNSLKDSGMDIRNLKMIQKVKRMQLLEIKKPTQKLANWWPEPTHDDKTDGELSAH